MGIPTTTKLRQGHVGAVKDRGRFAAHERREDDISLMGDDEPQPRYEATTELDDQLGYAYIRKMAKQLASSKVSTPEDLEDLAQDATVSLFKSIKDGSIPAVTPGLATKAVRHAIAQQNNVRNHIRHEDHAANVILDRQVDDRIQELGRMLTSREVDDMSTAVIANWKDQRHKPRVGFHKKIEILSTAHESIARWADEIPVEEPEMQPDGHDELEDLISDAESGETSQHKALAQMWTVLAQAGVIPELAMGLNRRHATKHRTDVNAAGGPSAALEHWADTGKRTPASEALFAPWGATTDEDRDKLTSFLLARPTITEELWTQALRKATASAQPAAAARVAA